MWAVSMEAPATVKVWMGHVSAHPGLQASDPWEKISQSQQSHNHNKIAADNKGKISDVSMHVW